MSDLRVGPLVNVLSLDKIGVHRRPPEEFVGERREELEQWLGDRRLGQMLGVECVGPDEGEEFCVSKRLGARKVVGLADGGELGVHETFESFGDVNEL